MVRLFSVMIAPLLIATDPQRFVKVDFTISSIIGTPSPGETAPRSSLDVDLSSNVATVKEELAKIKARNLERKVQREAEARAAAAAQQAEAEQKSRRGWWPWGECRHSSSVGWLGSRIARPSLNGSRTSILYCSNNATVPRCICTMNRTPPPLYLLCLRHRERFAIERHVPLSACPDIRLNNLAVLLELRKGDFEPSTDYQHDWTRVL